MLLWLQGPKEVKEDNRITFEQLEDEIVLVCRSAERPDEGNYSVTLRNNKGSDSATIRVNILDKPGVPEGPLEVSKITPESCTLKWNPPKVRLFHTCIVTRCRVLDRVQTHAGHSIAFKIFLYSVILWPWPLTFWPNSKWIAKTQDGLFLSQV